MRDTTSQTKQKEVVSHATFLWRLSSCKKSNWLIPSIGIDNQRSLQSDWMSGTTGHTQPKEVVSHVTFLWGLSLCKKSKRLTDSFQRYWWSMNNAIWLGESILGMGFLQNQKEQCYTQF